MTQVNRWDNFLKEIANILFFWFFGVAFFFLFRSVFVISFVKELSRDLSFNEYISAMFLGFRFDCTVVFYFLIIPLVSTLILSYFNKFNFVKKIREIFQYLFVILSTLFCILTINYYREFNDQFNNFLFLGLHDDKEAVFNTILEYYNPVLNALILIIVLILSFGVFKYFENRTFIYSLFNKIQSKNTRVFFILSILYLSMSCALGSFTYPEVQRRLIDITPSPSLNKKIMNPFRSLKYAHKDYKRLSEASETNPFVDNIQNLYSESRVSEIIKKKAQGATIEKPKQIFLVIMESYDSWPLMDKYSSFGLSNRLLDIANKGTFFSIFLPSNNATFYAYGTLTAGIPYNGINISILSTMSEPYITSVFEQFKKLGYTTNMFYGGFLSWENIGDFSLHLGCDNVYSANDAKTKIKFGAWGVDDEDLFDLVLDKVDSDEYTFNVILTSSYHTPYTVDVESKGFIYKDRDQFPDVMKKYDDERMSLLELGHLWYGDWAIGRFIDEAEEKYKNGLYAFTGDHFGRRFINYNPNLYEESAVPFIIYGKDIPTRRNNTPGSHIDIFPTLIELIAPKDFEYYSFGSSMLLPEKHYGIAFEKIIDSTAIYYRKNNDIISKVNLSDFQENKVETINYEDVYNKLMGLSWHYIVKGDSLANTNNRPLHRKTKKIF